jgi:alpha-glucuronidase
MKTAPFKLWLSLALLLPILPARAETGHDAWLRYPLIDDAAAKTGYDALGTTVVALSNSAIVRSARSELIRGASGLLGRAFNAAAALQPSPSIVLGTFAQVQAALPSFTPPADVGPEGFWLTTVPSVGGDQIVVTGPDERGVLYGAFALLRQISLREPIAQLNVKETPSVPIRYLNHWDNPAGTIERGYGGRSIFWDNNQVTTDLKRVDDYGRLLASIGINGTSINNVNADTRVITAEYLPQIAKIADTLRPWGVRMMVSVSLNSPTAIGGLQTADPGDPAVIAFWKAKVEEVYQAIPDLAGFVIKADSEGQPGPSQYGHTHADAANPIARALKPHHGVVFYRGFVYDNTVPWQDLSQDRAKAAYDNFIKLDGQFEDNAVIQVKNGPIDFQVREPASPLFGALKKTNEVIELQITPEYLGQSYHVVYDVPMWKTTLDFDMQVKGPGTPVKAILEGKVFGGKYGGFVGVCNVGRDENWFGHDLEMSNLYGFGRLAWNPDLSSQQIADEWTRQTFGADPAVVGTVDDILLKSWQAYEGYTGNLGIGGLTNIAGWTGYGGPTGASGTGPTAMVQGNHFAEGIESSETNSWGQWHRSNAAQLGLPMVVGSGMNRTIKDGTGYIGQYSPAVSAMFESLETCPDDLLLFMHHVPYTYVLHSGETVIQHMYDAHYAGAAQAQKFADDWAKLKGKIDDQRYTETLARLNFQAGHAVEWRDAVDRWFLQYSGVPDAKGRVGIFPGRTVAAAMKLEGYNLVDVVPWETTSGGQVAKLASTTAPGSASFNFTGQPGSYDIAVQYFDQSNGQSKFTLKVAGRSVDAWTADLDPPFTQPQDTSTRRTVRAVMLATGDEIRLEGDAGTPVGAVAGARRGAAGAGARGARGGAAATPGTLPTIDILTNQLTLTDAQAEQIAPMVTEVNKGAQDVATAQSDAMAARAASIAAITAILTDAQKPLFATYLNPAPAGRGRGGRGAGAGGGGGELASFDYVEITPHQN